MATVLNTRKKDKGWHIRDVDREARDLAKAAATLAGIGTGPWIARAIKEKFNREIARKKED